MDRSTAAGAAEAPPAAPPPSADAVRTAVGRILASPDFAVPDRDKRFLSYVVEETIAGRGDRIKAYSIATEVFGRDASFDPQTDPVVRIEAGRVRRALEHYYLTSGRDDMVVTTMPKGGYVPIFALRPAAGGRQAPPEPIHDGRDDERHHAARPQAPAAAAPSPMPRWAWLVLAATLGLAAVLAFTLLLLTLTLRDLGALRGSSETNAKSPSIPHLLVHPFEDLTATAESAIIARGLTEEVISRIAKFRDLVVIEAADTPDDDAAPSGDDAAPYGLAGSVRVESRKVRLTARLVSADGAVLWANTYDDDLGAHAVLELQDNIAGRVATALAQPDGIISRAAARASNAPPDDWEAYKCTLAYYTYRERFDPETRLGLRGCLQQAVQRFPDYATAWALLSIVYMDEVRFHLAPEGPSASSFDTAVAASRTAMELDPENMRALQAHMMILFFENDVEGALAAGRRALAINPNDTELLGEYGARLAVSGRWKEGGDYVARALERKPARPGYFEAVLALCFYMQRDYAAAAVWIKRADVQPNPIYHFIAATIYGQSGDTEAAGRERAWIIENAPDILRNLRQEFAMRNMRPADQAHFVEGLRKAGFSGI